MTKLVILGSRIFAEEVADLVEAAGDFELAGFVENFDRERCSEPLLGLPVMWIDEVADLAQTHQAICAIGTTRRSAFVEQARELGFGFARLVHPRAWVSPTAELGPGAIVNAGAVVGAHTQIGSHVILNRGVLVGHHTRIGDCVTVSPGANIAGCVNVGDGSYIGMGAIVIDRVTVGSGAVVGAGAVVTHDVADNVQVQGVPARVVKTDVDGR